MTAPLLFAPESYWTASPEIRNAIINGCGPGGWKVDLVPDTIYFLSIHECCDIHDWMYSVGRVIEDKDEADRAMLNNCLRLIKAAGGWWPLPMLRRNRAKAYWFAVHFFGGPAFWSGKNPPATLAPVAVELTIDPIKKETTHAQIDLDGVGTVPDPRLHDR